MVYLVFEDHALPLFYKTKVRLFCFFAWQPTSGILALAEFREDPAVVNSGLRLRNVSQTTRHICSDFGIPYDKVSALKIEIPLMEFHIACFLPVLWRCCAIGSSGSGLNGLCIQQAAEQIAVFPRCLFHTEVLQSVFPGIRPHTRKQAFVGGKSLDVSDKRADIRRLAYKAVESVADY